MVPPNFRWIVPDKLAGSGRPSRVDHIAGLADAGIAAIVSATPMPAEVEAAAVARRMDVLPLPVDDFDVPTDEQVRQFLRFTAERLARGRPVLVHCLAGIGRTGTLCALWLVHRGSSALDALHRVGVESPRQMALLRRWEDITLQERGT